MDLSVFFKKNELTLLDKNYFSEFINIKLEINSDLLDLFANYGGSSFNKGLLRIHTKASSYVWTDLVNNYYPEYRSKATVFCYDWMGRQFGLSSGASKDFIYIFDYAQNDVYELEQSLEGFFNQDLVDYIHNTLAVNTFNSLSSIIGDNLKISDCLSFKKPLALGGQDVIENYELSDMLVTWDLNYQIIKKVDKLSNNTLINKVKLIREKHKFGSFKSDN